MSEHTPRHVIRLNDDGTFQICFEGCFVSQDRVLAALKACTGIPTEALKGASVKAVIDAANKAPQYIEICKQEEINAGRPKLATMANADLIALVDALAPFLKGETDD